MISSNSGFTRSIIVVDEGAQLDFAEEKLDVINKIGRENKIDVRIPWYGECEHDGHSWCTSYTREDIENGCKFITVGPGEFSLPIDKKYREAVNRLLEVYTFEEE
ncbi:MAG: hypothetical protein HZB68_05455 [Candidatus Aenigmarchaeota archaeon]|nr:hypothetical protein [Candidatus Aenigmarchaeota archaeon]